MQKTMIGLLAFAAVLLMPSYGVAAAKETAKAEILTAPEGKALVYMFSSAFINLPRNSGSGGSSHEFAVDGLSLGQVGEREYLVFALTPGIHRVSQRAYTSWPWRNIEGEFQAGKVYFVKSAGSQIEPEPVFFERKVALKKLTKSKYKHAGSYEFNLDLRGQITSARKVEDFDSVAGQAATGKSELLTAVSTLPALESNSNGIAVIIGNRNYKQQNSDAPDVSYAINDAAAMKVYVSGVLGFAEQNILYVEDATQTQMVNLFGNAANYQGKVYDWVRPGESDLFIFYSGHGAPSLRDGKGYLLPVDADPNRVELNGYPLETLYNNLAQVPAKSYTVVLDACFSGGSQGGTIVKDASSIALKRVGTVATLPNSTILTAAGLSEVASWDNDAQHGLFTRHFLEGVSGKADQSYAGDKDGKVTLGELKDYLESEVTYQARRNYGREQHPQVSGSAARLMAELNPQ